MKPKLHWFGNTKNTHQSLHNTIIKPKMLNLFYVIFISLIVLVGLIYFIEQYIVQYDRIREFVAVALQSTAFLFCGFSRSLNIGSQTDHKDNLSANVACALGCIDFEFWIVLTEKWIWVWNLRLKKNRPPPSQTQEYQSRKHDKEMFGKTFFSYMSACRVRDLCKNSKLKCHKSVIELLKQQHRFQTLNKVKIG